MAFLLVERRQAVGLEGHQGHGVAGAQRIQPQMPRVVDAFLTTLYIGLSDGTLLDRGLINLDAVKAKLKRASATVLGQDVVQDALVQAVLQRNL